MFGGVTTCFDGRPAKVLHFFVPLWEFVSEKQKTNCTHTAGVFFRVWGSFLFFPVPYCQDFPGGDRKLKKDITLFTLKLPEEVFS